VSSAGPAPAKGDQPMRRLHESVNMADIVDAVCQQRWIRRALENSIFDWNNNYEFGVYFGA
jgi:hypothetical protein